MRTLRLLALVLGLLAITALVSPWIALGLGTLGGDFKFSRVYNRVFEVLLVLAIRETPAWLIGPGWPPLIGGVGGLVALVVTATLLIVVLRRRARLPPRQAAPTLAA